MRIRSVVLILLFVSSAALANTRSAVSVNGLDTNPCTTTSPCRSFGAAIAVTASGGEIIALDSAGYGPFSIPTSLTISGAPGVHAAITVTSGTGISIAPSSTDRVTLRNLVLIGSGGADGIIQTVQSQSLNIFDCLVQGFSDNAIFVDDADGAINIDRCAVIDNNGAYGVYVNGGIITPTRLTITNSNFVGDGIALYIGYNTDAAIVNTTVAGNPVYGIQADNENGSFSSTTQVVVENCTIDHNGTGVYSIAANLSNVAKIALSQNVIAYNSTATSTAGVGLISSFGNNRFVGNGVDGGPFPPVAFQ